MRLRTEAPHLRPFASLTVEVGAPIEIGMTAGGRRRVVPITGGSAVGDGWTGTVLPAGADFQRYPGPSSAALSAHYVVAVDGGPNILVENEALRVASPEDLDRMMSGGSVPDERVYFRSVPRLSAPIDSAFAWLNERIFIGTGRRRPEHVEIDIFCVD